MSPTDLPARLGRRVREDPATGCWNWTGAIDRYGYAQVGVPRTRRMTVAHREAFVALRGAIPDGLVLDHLCRNRRCVNPVHLEAVTHAENVRRGARATATTCRRGHPYDDTNTKMRADNGARRCRECQKAAEAAYAARKRGTA